MELDIRWADFDDPALSAFLAAHLADMAPQSPVESQHALALEALRRPGIRMWVAMLDGRIAGTCALADVAAEHEELKSMRTDPALRGRGVASRLLRHVLDDAGRRQLERVSLETGAAEFFAPARALYRKFGFARCRPFGAYAEDPHSVYMTRYLRETDRSGVPA